eukprot:UN15415
MCLVIRFLSPPRVGASTTMNKKDEPRPNTTVFECYADGTKIPDKLWKLKSSKNAT